MLYILTTFFLLAAGITVNKYILEILSPTWFVAIRMSLTGLLLMSYNVVQLPRERWKPLKQEWRSLSSIALCTTLLPSLLKAFGLKYMFAAKSTLLCSIDPFVTALYSYLLWKEQLSYRKLIGVLLGCVGVVIMAIERSPEESSWQTWGWLSLPELAIFASIAISRYGWMRAQEILRSERYTPSQLNGIIMLLSGLASCLVAVAAQEPLEMPPSQGAPLLFFCSILGANVIGYVMYANCLKQHSSTLISLAGFLVPLLVALFARLWLNEPLTPSLLSAASCILVGLCVFYLDAKSSLKPTKS